MRLVSFAAELLGLVRLKLRGRESPITTNHTRVLQLRMVVTTENFDEALQFYRDVLGLPELPSVQSPHGRVAILDAGRATLEIADPKTAEFIDDVEVGR